MENKNEINYDLFSVKDKVIALIGCTGILGARYTELFASLGAKVVMGDLDYDRCSKLAIEMEEKYNADVYPVLVDITDEERAVDDLIVKIKEFESEEENLIQLNEKLLQRLALQEQIQAQAADGLFDPHMADEDDILNQE